MRQSYGEERHLSQVDAEVNGHEIVALERYRQEELEARAERPDGARRALRRLDSLNREAGRQRALLRIANATAENGPVAALYAFAAEAVGEASPGDLVDIFELSPEAGTLRLRASHGRQAGEARPEVASAAAAKLLHEALDASSAVVFTGRPGALASDLRGGSGVAVAIGRGSELPAILRLTSRSGRAFEPGDVDFLATVAAMLTAACRQRERGAARHMSDIALEAIDEAVLMLDATRAGHPACHVNGALERLTGFSPGDVLGHGLRRLAGAETRAEPLAMIEAALESGSPFRGSLRLHRKDGSAFWADLALSPVPDESGAPARVLCVIADATLRTELQADLAHVQKMDTVGHLTGGIAHDFNNVLTVIISNAEIVAEGIHNPALKAIAEQVLQAAECGADLTRRLVALARKAPPRSEPLVLEELVEGMTGMLGRTLGRRFTLRTELSGGSRVIADRSLVESAILNLVVNARDAMPDGGTLTIATGADAAGGPDDAGGFVRLTVRDTGIGMSKETAARALEPYFTTKGPGDGTGLGLAMVADLAKGCGGRVEIDSAPGLGAAVNIFLKRALRGGE